MKFKSWSDVIADVKERALRAGLGHVCSSFDETVVSQNIIDEMRGDGLSTGKGVLFEPCEQYQYSSWEELADTVELIARDMYEFACAMYESMPQCAKSIDAYTMLKKLIEENSNA